MRKLVMFFMVLFAFHVQAIELPVHHQYINVITGIPDKGIYNHDIHITINKDPDVSRMGYYAMFAFTFENGVQGYLGLQKDHTQGKKAIFSIWDFRNGQTAFPTMKECNRFGHEGAGTQCIQKFDWKVGHEYKLRLWRTDDQSPHADKWAMWVIDYTTGAEFLVGEIETRNSGGYKGYGNLSENSIISIENYQTTNTKHVSCEEIKDFSVTWRGPFSNNGKVMPQYATANFQTNVGNPCVHNNDATSTAPFTVTTRAGVDVANRTNGNNDLWGKYDYNFYTKLECMFNWAEREAPGSYNQKPFKQRRLSKSVFGFYMRDYTVDGIGIGLIVDTATKTVSLSKEDGTMENIGALDHWLRTANCHR